jgi:hypothetical protein
LRNGFEYFFQVIALWPNDFLWKFELRRTCKVNLVLGVVLFRSLMVSERFGNGVELGVKELFSEEFFFRLAPSYRKP